LGHLGKFRTISKNIKRYETKRKNQFNPLFYMINLGL